MIMLLRIQRIKTRLEYEGLVLIFLINTRRGGQGLSDYNYLLMLIEIWPDDW